MLLAIGVLAGIAVAMQVAAQSDPRKTPRRRCLLDIVRHWSAPQMHHQSMRVSWIRLGPITADGLMTHRWDPEIFWSTKNRAGCRGGLPLERR